MGTQQMGTKVCLKLCQIFLSGRRPDGYKAGWKYNSLGIKAAGTINETKSENYQEKDCVNVCDKERGQLISFRVEGLKQRQKKKSCILQKWPAWGLGSWCWRRWRWWWWGVGESSALRLWVACEKSISGKGRFGGRTVRGNQALVLQAQVGRPVSEPQIHLCYLGSATSSLQPLVLHL